MATLYKRIFLTFCILVLRVGVSSAFALSSSELIVNAKKHDGTIVMFEGEVIGDIMVRGDYAWLNISDGEHALGVWADKGLTDAITYTGSYQHQGDIVEIEGEFHRACPRHGGDIDLHARTIRIIARGKKIIRPFDRGKRNLAVILTGLVCLGLILKRLK